MTTTRLTRAETETLIRRSADEKCYDIFTEIPKDIRRFRRLADAYGLPVEETQYGIRLRGVPLGALMVRKTRPQSRKVATAPDISSQAI